MRSRLCLFLTILFLTILFLTILNLTNLQVQAQIEDAADCPVDFLYMGYGSRE